MRLLLLLFYYIIILMWHNDWKIYVKPAARGSSICFPTLETYKNAQRHTFAEWHPEGAFFNWKRKDLTPEVGGYL